MRIGVGLGSQLGLPFEELVALAGPATELRFDSVWTPKRTMPDSFHICLRWFEESVRHRPEGIGVGIGVLPAPQQWHPASLASQAATVATATGGRFVLGIGTGGYGPAFWKHLGLPDKPIAVMRDYLDILRTAFRGEPVDYEGRVLRVRDFVLDQAPPAVPVYLGALGPQMLRLAGRCADGVLMNWASPAAIAAANDAVAEGAAAAGRRRGEVSLAMYLRCVVDEDVDAARRVIAAEVLQKLRPSRRRGTQPALGYRGQFARLGFEGAILAIEERFAAGASVTDLLDDVPADMCAAAGYFGTAADAPARVAELTRGLDEVVIRIVTTRPGIEPIVATMEALAPARLRAAGA